MICPINFDDCPDCQHYKAGSCEYDEEEEQAKEHFKRFEWMIYSHKEE